MVLPGNSSTELMIPRIIHYCWFGRGPMPELAQKCIASWHRNMPDYAYKLWDEDKFDLTSNKYAREAYEARRFAFVSDYVRLWALEREGGIYMDVDFMVFKPFDDLLQWRAFAGFEGSKYLPIRMGVFGSEAHGEWVSEMLRYYQNRQFVKADGSFDLTTNVKFLSAKMREHGFVQDGREQDYKDLHIFPVEYFSPRQTTGEYFRTENTYCDHLGLNSWSGSNSGWKDKVGKVVGAKIMTRLIKLKRKLKG